LLIDSASLGDAISGGAQRRLLEAYIDDVLNAVRTWETEASDRLAFWFAVDRTIRFIKGEAVGGSNDKNCVLACA
jgi:hypothetical protein